jgi:hypothetical protein
MSNEDYGRITRILADGTPVTLEFNIVNRIYPEARLPTTPLLRFLEQTKPTK